MVVCRLRKNSEFRLDSNPRRRSHDKKQSSGPENNNNNNNCAALSGVEYSGVREGTMVAAESCSKEGSSSYNSHSVEQNDSGFEWDDKTTNDMSPHGSSSHWRIQVFLFFYTIFIILCSYSKNLWLRKSNTGRGKREKWRGLLCWYNERRYN